MKTYRIYLENKGLAPKTVSQYLEIATEFLTYSQVAPEQVSYPHLLAYIRYLQQRQLAKKTINVRLGALRHYFSCLVANEKRNDNPAQHLKVKGAKRSQACHWLSYQELDETYEKYCDHFPTEETGQVALSLLMYQGLSVSELRVLTAEMIDLRTGKIQVPATNKSNARTLMLDLRQMLLFVRFLMDKTGLLFASQSDKTLPNLVAKLMKQVKTLHPGMRNSWHIRGSIIAHWLRTEDLRIVQYKAGHRYVSSTERYQTAHLEELQQEISKAHPLK